MSYSTDPYYQFSNYPVSIDDSTIGNGILLGVAILVIIILIAAIAIYISYKKLQITAANLIGSLPVYNNQVLDTIKSNESWEFVSASGNIPYTFQILGNNQLQVSFYDSAGYLKGFS